MDANYNFSGLVQFLNIFKNELGSRKRIAQFDSYKTAKEDILMELASVNKISYSDLVELLSYIEKVTDIELYFNEL